jgi:hypothetical protein
MSVALSSPGKRRPLPISGKSDVAPPAPYLSHHCSILKPHAPGLPCPSQPPKWPPSNHASSRCLHRLVTLGDFPRKPLNPAVQGAAVRCRGDLERMAISHSARRRGLSARLTACSRRNAPCPETARHRSAPQDRLLLTAARGHELVAQRLDQLSALAPRSSAIGNQEKTGTPLLHQANPRPYKTLASSSSPS